jgi:hypothetical protein
LGVTSAINLVEADQNGNVKVITPTGKVPSYAAPSEDKESNTKRIIADSISPKDISNFLQQGCSVKHLLKDATALECPTSVVPTLKNVREDKLIQIHDLDADIQINADDVWNGVPSYQGTGIVIAILDTGVDTKHIELQDSIIKTKSFKGSPKDSNGHGTHVSGIITGNGVFEISNNFGYPSPNKATGVAPDAGIIIGKVCAPRGCFYSDIAAGIEWAVAEGADVISISIGGSPIGGDNCDGDFIADKSNCAVDNGVVDKIHLFKIDNSQINDLSFVMKLFANLENWTCGFKFSNFRFFLIVPLLPSFLDQFPGFFHSIALLVIILLV